MFSMFDKLFLLIAVNFVFSGCLAYQECPADRQKPWSYNSNLPNGPEHWGKSYPQCNGLKQSPINIPSYLVQEKDSKALHLIRYNKPITKFMIENTGYTVQITPKDGVSRAMQIKGHTYTLQSFHFHWGKEFYEGAEHSIDGVTASMELHLVHQDTSGNIAVLGVLSDVQAFENYGITPLVNYFAKVTYAKEKTTVDGSKNKKRHVNLSYLLPKNSPYCIYTGSLTTPPCSPNVTWVVYDHHSFLNEDQISHFRQLSSTTKENAGKDGRCNLVNNFRPIQKNNKRKIYYYKEQK